MLETEYMLAVESSIQTEVELALEGASNEALKIFSSARMSDVKDDMREGIELYNKGQYKKAVPILEKSIGEMKQLRRDIMSVQNFPLSSMLSPLYSVFSSVPKMFSSVEDPMLKNEFKAKLKTQAFLNAVLRTVTVIPYLGQMVAVLSDIVRISQWNENKRNAPEQIGSYFNDVRSDLAFIVDTYIANAEEILRSAKKRATSNRATESIDRILDELF